MYFNLTDSGLCTNISGDDAEHSVFEKLRSYAASCPTVPVVVLFNYTMNMPKWQALCIDFPAVTSDVENFFKQFSVDVEYDALVLCQTGSVVHLEVVFCLN